MHETRLWRQQRLVVYGFLFPPLFLLFTTLGVLIAFFSFALEWVFFGAGAQEWIEKRFGVPGRRWQEAAGAFRNALPDARSPEALSELIVLWSILSKERHVDVLSLCRLLQQNITKRLPYLTQTEAQRLSPQAWHILLAQVNRQARGKRVQIDFLVAILLTLTAVMDKRAQKSAQALITTSGDERVREAALDYLNVVS